MHPLWPLWKEQRSAVHTAVANALMYRHRASYLPFVANSVLIEFYAHPQTFEVLHRRLLFTSDLICRRAAGLPFSEFVFTTKATSTPEADDNWEKTREITPGPAQP